MNPETAKMLLSALLERLNADAVSEKPNYGYVVSGLERAALALMLGSDRGEQEAKVAITQPSEEFELDILSGPATSAQAPFEAILFDSPSKLTSTINDAALDAKVEATHIICIDFGTAKSKAFARRIEGDEINAEALLELGLGRLDGDLDSSPYTVASSVWISDDGSMFAGASAMRRSSNYGIDGKARKRLDSVKQQLSQASHVNQLLEPLSHAVNPTSEPLSFEDAICFFLGYLIDLIGSELETKHQLSRYMPKRFTVPAWSDEQREWANSCLRNYLKRAHILADTFRGRWTDGITVAELKSANLQAKVLESQLEHLLDAQLKDSPLGISEPIAAGSARLSTDKNIRNMVLVVDVGAGTTDFALFLVPHGPGGSKAFPLRLSEAVKAAGDRVDDILVEFILSKMDGHTDTETRNRVAARLRLRNLRTLKRRLFQDGIIEIDLVTDERVIIDRDEFLNSSAVITFAKTLENRLVTFLQAVHPSFSGATQDALILFTGGGANLPFVAALAQKMWIIGEKSFRFRLPQKPVPDLIAEFGDAFLAEYGQLAVAIGGTLPLIDERKTHQGEWYGGALPPGRLDRYQISGV